MPSSSDSSNRPHCCGETDAAAVQLAEYNQMYAIGLYRLNALDQRIPLVCGILTTTLASVGLMPPPLQLALLLSLPLSIVWLFRTTVGHARSFEDCLRRIEQLEQSLNRHFGRDLIDFQSSHPSRGIVAGGRTGEESVVSVLVVSLVLLTACGYAYVHLLEPHDESLALYLLYLVLVAVTLASNFKRLLSYRYQKNTPATLP